ncbi:MAG: SpoIIE family protein phosphatase [Planctomycetes bacterium]|nr:SpoIIE family protein phosphatase [Planctomycetota bacterium]
MSSTGNQPLSVLDSRTMAQERVSTVGVSDIAARQPVLTDFVDVETLQLLQDGFAALTGISTSIRDAAGNPLTRASARSEFCDLVGSTASGAAACRMSHANASAVVRGEERPCHHECHAGLSQFVAPIVVQGHHLGTIIIGDRPAKPLTKLGMSTLAETHGFSADALSRAAKELDPWDESAMSSAAAFVHQLASTIAQLCYQSFQLQRRIDELATVYDIAAMLTSKASLQEILDMATRQLVETMHLKAASLRLVDEDTGELKLKSVANLSPKYLSKGPVRLADSAIDRLALEGKTVYVEDCRTDPRIIYKRMAREEGLGSALVTAVSFRGKRVGVLWAYMGERHAFSPFDVSLLEAIASQLAGAVINARLRTEVREAEQLERQVKHAADVQRRMIPARPPANPRFQFGCIYQPSHELGGDFYDFIEFDNGDVGLVVADVVGKGIPASLMMASARSALRSHARRVTDMGEIMQSVNRRLHHDTLPSEFATAFYVELAADGSHAKYCNAGHEPLLLLRRGELHEYDVGGMALGIDPDEAYPCEEIRLEREDVLLLFTDGVTEARDFHDKAYGRNRLHQSLRLHGSIAPDIPVEFIAKQVLWDVRRFVGLAPQGDDITIVVVRVK